MVESRNINCKTRPVQRAAGQSAVVGAAYRAGERLFDERQERVADFSRRAPDVRETLILAPEGAPDWASDRSALWNAAEAAEKRKDGRPARDVQLGLAWELSPDEQKAAVIEFAESEFVSKGHVTDIAFHRYGQRVVDASEEGRATIRRWAEQDVPFLESDECVELNSPHAKIERSADGGVTGYKIYQPHAHVYVTPRALDGDAFAAKRNREFDRAETAMRWRYEWPRIHNDHLERAGESLRVTATARKDGGQHALRDESVQGVARSMELRGEETRARVEAEFAQIHNDAIRQAVADSPQEPPEEPQEAQAPDLRQSNTDDTFEAVHDAAQAQASADLSEPPDESNNSRMQRMAAWWDNARQSFSEWRGSVVERASERWQEFRGQSDKAGPQEREPDREPDQ